MLESQRLGEERQEASLAANIVISLVVGVAAAAAGQLIGSML
jgi:CrcB protein